MILMLDKIFKLFTNTILFMSILLIGFSYTYSAELSPESKGDNPLKIVITQDEDQQELTPKEKSMKELFGDEQAFPFVAGLGKNSGKP